MAYVGTSPECTAADPGEFVVYPGHDGSACARIRLSEGTLWMTQRQIAEVYGVTVPTIHAHLEGLYVEEELDPARTIRQIRIVQKEGNRCVARLVEQYALATILAVGYRVRSFQGNQFRAWATQRLSEYLVERQSVD